MRSDAVVPIDLQGRVVLICGAGDGIGLAVTQAFAGAGATLVVVDREQALVDRAAAAAGQGALGILADLMGRAQTDAILPRIADRFGRIDGVVNVAGGTRQEQWREIERLDDDMADAVMRLNFGYSLAICRDAARLMIANGTKGSIVNFGSISALVSAPYHAVYGAAKNGLMALSRSLALEWARHGIRVNSVSPGAVETDRVLAQVGYRHPDERWGRRVTRPEEIANTCLFLLSDLASGISGQNLTVDAGLTVEYPAGGIAAMARKIYDVGVDVAE